MVLVVASCGVVDTVTLKSCIHLTCTHLTCTLRSQVRVVLDRVGCCPDWSWSTRSLQGILQCCSAPGPMCYWGEFGAFTRIFVINPLHLTLTIAHEGKYSKVVGKWVSPKLCGRLFEGLEV